MEKGNETTSKWSDDCIMASLVKTLQVKFSPIFVHGFKFSLIRLLKSLNDAYFCLKFSKKNLGSLIDESYLK